MSRCSKATRQLLRTTSFWVLCFLLLTSLGALLFSEVERPSAISRLKSKDEKLASLQNEMKTEYNMTNEEFARFVNLSSEALSLDGPAWNYLDGLRYTFETLTTIGKHNLCVHVWFFCVLTYVRTNEERKNGQNLFTNFFLWNLLGYGTISPSTSQALCIVFAILGIPVTILAFKSVGELISLGISSTIAFVETKCCRKEPTHVEAKCTVATCLLMMIMLLLGAIMQSNFDDWSYLEACYFWVITFTTIGYGDYIAGSETRKKGTGNPKTKVVKSLNVAFHIAWTTIGLCVFSSVLNAAATFIEKRTLAKRRCGKRSCCCCAGQQESDSEKGDTLEKYTYQPSANGRARDKIQSREDYNCMTYV